MPLYKAPHCTQRFYYLTKRLVSGQFLLSGLTSTNGFATVDVVSSLQSSISRPLKELSSKVYLILLIVHVGKIIFLLLVYAVTQASFQLMEGDTLFKNSIPRIKGTLPFKT